MEQEEHEAVVELVKESGDMVTLNVQSIKQEKITKLHKSMLYVFHDLAIDDIVHTVWTVQY